MLLLVGMNIAPTSGIDLGKQSIGITHGRDTLYVGGSGEGDYTKIQDAINDTSVAKSNVDLIGNPDLIKITEEFPCCDIDNYFVVYSDSKNLYVYNIKTGETDKVYVGGNIVFPKISENRVVYNDFSYMGFKLYNITTGDKTDLIVTNWHGGGTDSFQFFGNYIVYENYDPDLYSTEIFLYNIATGENIQLTDSPGKDYPQNPCIYKNIVAWQLSEGNQIDIVMYNIESEKYTRVTNTSQFEWETDPSIYDNNIVYSYYYNDKTGTIIYGLKMYNIATGDETTIFEGEEPTANSPEIFGSVIVYSRSDCLYLYDLNTNYETPIYESFGLTQPWNLNENYVLFTVLGEGVYLYKYNNVPDAPEIEGPTIKLVPSPLPKQGEPINYTFKSTDPDGDNVSYYIDWDDGNYEDWFGPYESGEEVVVNHTWSEKNVFTIRAKAKDIYGAESDWGTLEVTIPKNQQASNMWFLRWLDRFPILQKILDVLRVNN